MTERRGATERRKEGEQLSRQHTETDRETEEGREGMRESQRTGLMAEDNAAEDDSYISRASPAGLLKRANMPYPSWRP